MKPNSFTLNSIDEDDVRIRLEKINSNKSTGLDSIPARFLKDGSSILKIPLTSVINLSIQSGIFPNEFKLCRNEVGNYRPIAFFPVFRK